MPTKEIQAFCIACGKVLYEGDNYLRDKLELGRRRTPEGKLAEFVVILCENCQFTKPLIMDQIRQKAQAWALWAA